MLRRRHFFGRLRLRKSEVPEPTPAPTELGRLRLQAIKGGSRPQADLAPYTNSCPFELLKSELLIEVFLDHIYRYKLLFGQVCHNNKAFLFCLPKRCSRSRLKIGGSGSRLRQQKSRLRLHPNSGGSGSATLLESSTLY